MDLEDFFGTINFGRIRGLLAARPYGIGPEAALFVAQLCCHDRHLPQGAPTSPILSNMVCAKLDGELQRLCARVRCEYSRYADDITISTRAEAFPGVMGSYSGTGYQVGPELSRVIAQNGFRVNAKKVRLRRPGERQEVTGLVVNRDPNVDRRLVRQVRAMIHAWSKFGLERAEGEHLVKYRHKHRAHGTPPPCYSRVLKGKLDFIRMVRGQRDPVYRGLLKRYSSVAKLEYLDLAPEDPVRGSIPEALWVLECAEDRCGQGTAFALSGVGIVTCDHVLCEHLVAFRADEPGRRYRVETLARSGALDLAVLRVLTDRDVGELRRGVSEALDGKSEVAVWGFPNYRLGDTPQVHYGRVSGRRMVRTVRRFMVDARIVRGNSGGPVLNSRNEVVGVAVTGADRHEDGDETEDHGVIPVEALEKLLAIPP